MRSMMATCRGGAGPRTRNSAHTAAGRRVASRDSVPTFAFRAVTRPGDSEARGPKGRLRGTGTARWLTFFMYLTPRPAARPVPNEINSSIGSNLRKPGAFE